MNERKTIADKAMEWLKDRRGSVSNASFGSYKRKVDKIISVVGKYHVDEGDVALEQLEKNVSDYQKSTKEMTIQILKRILKFEKTEESHTRAPSIDNPAIGIVSKDYIEILKNYLKENKEPIDISILIVMYTGVKVGEICSLKWENVDLTNAKILVKKARKRIDSPGEGKQEKTIIEEIDIPPRDIKMPTKLLRILLCNSKQPEKYVMTATINPLEPRTAQYKLRNICQKLGIPNITYSDLRDYFAVNALVNGMNPCYLSKIMGIDYGSMVKYIEFSQGFIDEEAEIEKINRI